MPCDLSARVVEKVDCKEDPSNPLLMHAVGANVSGQIAFAIDQSTKAKQQREETDANDGQQQ